MTGVETDTTLANGPVEEAAREGRGDQRADRRRTGGFTKDGHVIGITAKCGDVLLDPLECGDLIEEAVVAGGVVTRLFGEIRMRKKSENTEAVIHANDQHTFFGEVAAVLTRFGGRACSETTTVDPDHHGQLGLRGFRGHPEIEIEAVFTGAGVVENHVIVDTTLHTAWAVVDGFANPRPGCRRLRRLPAQWTDGRRGVGDALEGSHFAVGANDTFEDAIGGTLLDVGHLLGVDSMAGKQQSERKGPFPRMEIHFLPSSRGESRSA